MDGRALVVALADPRAVELHHARYAFNAEMNARSLFAMVLANSEIHGILVHSAESTDSWIVTRDDLVTLVHTGSATIAADAVVLNRLPNPALIVAFEVVAVFLGGAGLAALAWQLAGGWAVATVVLAISYSVFSGRGEEVIRGVIRALTSSSRGSSSD